VPVLTLITISLPCIIQEALAESGFSVTRLNTYNTSAVKSVAPGLLEAAVGAQVVTFGSPSAVKAWVELVGLQVRSRGGARRGEMRTKNKQLLSSTKAVALACMSVPLRGSHLSPCHDNEVLSDDDHSVHDALGFSLLQTASEKLSVCTLHTPRALQTASEKLSVCIGTTSARACDAAGLPRARIFYPESPGVEGWIEAVLRAFKEHGIAYGHQNVTA